MRHKSKAEPPGCFIRIRKHSARGAAPIPAAPGALTGAFGDGHAMGNLGTRMASRKEPKGQLAEGASKSQSSRGGPSKEAKKAATDDEGRKPTRLIDRALHDTSGEAEENGDAKAADCTALRPLTLKLAKVYKPCALVVKKTELMEGVADTHGIRPRRKEDIVDWLVRVLYKLEYHDHGLLTYGSWGRYPARET